GLDAPTPSTVLSPRATYITAAPRSAGRSRVPLWPPHAQPATSPASASIEDRRVTDSPRLRLRLPLRPRDALRLARSGSQTRLAARVAEPPRPPLGSHDQDHRLASARASPSPRGFCGGSPVPGRVGEGDRADRRERDTGVTVRGDVRAPGGGVTDRAEPAGERLGDLAIAVEGPHTFTEAAPHEHRTVEGEREIARQLRTERRARACHIAGDRERHRGDDLEARECFARALPPALERRQRDLADVGGRAEPEDRAVGDLTSQLQHLAGERGEVDPRRRRPLGERETPSNA